MQLFGIDQGTTSTRAITLNADGQLHVTHAISHQQSFPHQGFVEQDPEELLRNIQLCLASAGPIDAIGLDNQGESCLAWDAETKEALYPVISWQDQRTSSKLEKMRADGLEAQTLALSGLPIDPYFSASKLGWLVEHVGEVKAALKRGTLRLGTTDAFFLDRLTGKFVTDVTTASRTSLMSLRDLTWNETLCDIFGVPIDCLPEITASTGDFGAVETDLGGGGGYGGGWVPVTASVVDQQAALYGFGCRKVGETKMTFGTGAFALMVTGDEIIQKPEAGLLPTVAWQLDKKDAVYALDGGVFTASSAVNWAKSLGLFKDVSEINSFDAPSAIEAGLAFVPALAGLGCPHWQPNARGVWVGLSLGHRRDHLVQSILEGVAFRAAQVISAMDQCVGLRGGLQIDGGMSKNPYFVQFLADVLEREIRPAAVPELTGLGTLLLACDVLGEQPEVASDFERVLPQEDKSNHKARFDQAVAIASHWGNTDQGAMTPNL